MDNRNKESLAIDLKRPEARAVLEKLVRKADVFITNFPFPVRERLQLRAEDLTHLNKRLIYASLSPYGEHGPERDRTGFDTTAWWARSGLMDMVRATGDTEPALSMPGMGDHPTAMAMYAAIVTALYRRQTTGEGGVGHDLAGRQRPLVELVPGAGLALRLRADRPAAARRARRDGGDLHHRRRPLVHPHHHQPGPRLAAAGQGDGPSGVAGGPAVRHAGRSLRQPATCCWSGWTRIFAATPGSTGARG